MNRLPWKLFSIAVIFWIAHPISSQGDTYSYSGSSGGSWTTSGNWYDVTTSTSSGFPGSTTSTADIADLGVANNTVVYNAALNSSDTIGQLNFTASSAGGVNELDDQYLTAFSASSPSTAGLIITNAVTLGNGTGTQEIYLDPQSTTNSSDLVFANGASIGAGGVLEIGNDGNVSTVLLSTTITVGNSTTLTLNGGTIDIDRTSKSGGGSGATLGDNQSVGLLQIQSGTVVVGNYSSTSNSQGTSSVSLNIGANLYMSGGSITTGVDPYSTTTPVVTFGGDSTSISGGTLSAGNSYVYDSGNDGSPHAFKSDVLVPNLTVSQYGTYTSQIGAYTNGGTLNLGSLVVAQTHTGSVSYNGTVQLSTNVSLTSGGAMLTANDTANAGYNPTNTLSLNGYTLDLTGAGSGTTTFTPNNSNSNTWAFTGTGTIKAYAFKFNSAYNTSVSGAVTFQATGGNSSQNDLGNSATGSGSLTSSTFLYSGSAVAATPATLASSNGRTIGAVQVQSGFLSISTAANGNLSTGNSVSVTGGGLMLNGANTATLGTLTVSSGSFSVSNGTLALVLGAGTGLANGSDEILGNSGGTFSLTNLTLSITQGTSFNTATSYQLLSGFSTSAAVNNIATNISGFDANINSSGLLTFSSVPEPSSWMLLFVGGITLVIYRLRKWDYHTFGHTKHTSRS